MIPLFIKVKIGRMNIQDIDAICHYSCKIKIRNDIKGGLICKL